MTSAAVPSRAFLCMRHGVTDWNRQRRFQGRSDVPLNEEGLSQARAAAEILRGTSFDLIISSPLTRAVKTAETIAQTFCKPLFIDAELIECDFGSFEGRVIAEVMAEHGLTVVEALATILPPDGEPWPQLSERSLRCVATWLDCHPRSSLPFVSHDAVIQAISEALCRRWFNNPHATPVRFSRTESGWTIDKVKPR